MNFFDVIAQTFAQSGFAQLTIQQLIMILVSFALLYCGIVLKFEPLLLVPIAFGMLLANLPAAGLMTDATLTGGAWYQSGVLRIIYMGVKSSIFPCLIFMGVGAMTDFGPLIANPISLLLGAAAQMGIYVAFVFANLLGRFITVDGLPLFTAAQAAAIAIIGGADGPTAIYTTANILPPMLLAGVLTALSVVGCVALILLRRKNK